MRLTEVGGAGVGVDVGRDLIDTRQGVEEDGVLRRLETVPLPPGQAESAGPRESRDPSERGSAPGATEVLRTAGAHSGSSVANTSPARGAADWDQRPSVA